MRCRPPIATKAGCCGGKIRSASAISSATTATATKYRTHKTTLNTDGEIRKLQKREFDDLGRLWKVIGVDDQVVQQRDYDENNNPVSVTDYNQRTLVQAFDGLNRLKSVTDREYGLAEFTYNGQDELVKVKDQEGQETVYVVDGFGRRIQQTSPDTGTTVYHYDLSDNLTEMTDARQVVTTHTYAALNRLTATAYPATPLENVTYRYDETATGSATNVGRGRLTSITEAGASTAERRSPL